MSIPGKGLEGHICPFLLRDWKDIYAPPGKGLEGHICPSLVRDWKDIYVPAW